MQSGVFYAFIPWIVVGALLLPGCKPSKQGKASTPLSRKAHASQPRPSKQPRRRAKKTGPRKAPKARSCMLKQHRWGWYQRAYLTTDRTSLEKMYRRMGYRLPHRTRSLMMATRVVRGVGQAAFQMYSVKDTGFRYSHSKQRWWPASCVKPWAVAGALMTLRKYGLDGKSRLVFRDRYGKFDGDLFKLYYNITNRNYDRMMTIAGLDSLNGPAWRKKYSYPNMVLLRAYGGMRSLRRSPRITYYHKGKRGVIPRRYAKLRFKRCRSNCTTLFELQDVLRRIALHHELPSSQRFTLTSADQKRIMKAFLKIPNKMGRAFRKVWGRRSKGYNKSGSARGWDQIENVFIVPQRSKYRFLIAGSVPWWRKDYMADPSLLVLNEFGRRTMLALKRMTTRRVSLQMDAGLPMQIRLSVPNPRSRTLQLHIQAPGIDRIQAWDRTRPFALKRSQPGHFTATLQAKKAGKRLLVFQGYKGKKAVSYRSVGVVIPPSSQSIACAP